MCGILGEFSPSFRLTDLSVMEQMRDTMVHRGPDGGGLWQSQRHDCTLAHRRLSIIDLSGTASQPMVDGDGDLAIVFNGEIYNHAQIRRELKAMGVGGWKTSHSDTEVILKAYRKWGLDCVHKFYGMFSFAIYDNTIPDRPVVHLVRDRVGIKPLYITQRKNGCWMFASEIKAILKHPDVSPELDRTAFWHYLTFIVAPAPLTLFRGIFKLPAGYFVTIDHEGLARAKQWWDPVPSAQDTLRESDLSFDEAVDEFTSLMRQSVERRMVSDVPFGALLSGGVDSSLNVALMAELMDRPVTTFSIGYEGQDEYNEFSWAEKVAKRFNTDHHTALISHMDAQKFLPELVRLQDEPIADNVCIPLYFLAKLVQESGTTVVQVGEGADENYLGYWWCDHYRQKWNDVYSPALSGGSWWHSLRSRFNKVDGEDAFIRQRATLGQELFWGGAVCWWGDLRNQLTPSSASFEQEVVCPIRGLMPVSHLGLESADVVGYYQKNLTGNLSDPEVLQKIPYMELKLRLPEHLLMRVDKLTMAHSVEARVPFLDHDVVEFARRLPSAYKLAEGVGKKIIKKAAESYLDMETIYRKKQGFGAPMEEWFKEDDFAGKCRAAIKTSPLTEDMLDRKYLLSLLEKQRTSGGGYSFHLWTVMNALIWHKYWVEGHEDCF